MVVISTTRERNSCSWQTSMEVRDMPDQCFPTRHVSRRMLVNSMLAPRHLQEATTFSFVGALAKLFHKRGQIH